MGLLRTLAIIILVIYALRILARLFAPLVLRYVAKKAEKQFAEKFNQHQKQQTRHKEGETVIDNDNVPKGKNNSSNKVGEYIDFEEID